MIPIRTWATPLTIGAFVLMATTGVLIFFHLDTGLNKEAHEWLSWAFLAGVGGHVVANFPALKKHLAGTIGRTVVAVFLILLAGSFVLGEDEEGGGRRMRAIAEGVSNAPMETVAAVSGTTTDALMDNLRTHGYPATSSAQTIRELSNGDRERENKILGLVFSDKGK